MFGSSNPLQTTVAITILPLLEHRVSHLHHVLQGFMVVSCLEAREMEVRKKLRGGLIHLLQRRIIVQEGEMGHHLGGSLGGSAHRRRGEVRMVDGVMIGEMAGIGETTGVMTGGVELVFSSRVGDIWHLES